ncbi:MAG: hypothetical protein K2X81_16860 [Candidatus Obscuribacterales bacterium]|nr:hypothetical protein [Candidatus Obscuribacterales bacterium]
MSISSQQSSCNYATDRSKSFKHNVPEGIIPKGSPSVEEYIQNERAKQSMKLRDWRLQAKAASCDSIKAEFSASRRCHELSHEQKNPRVLLGWSVAGLGFTLGLAAMLVHF